MLHLADRHLAVRQNLATGRIGERITGRGLDVVSASLSARIGAGPFRPIAARFMRRAEGYFAFNLQPARDMPDFSAALDVTLRAEFQRDGNGPIVIERTVQGSDLTLRDNVRDIAGRQVIVRTIAGAPVDLSITTDPAAVALQGIVLRNHDPSQPLADIGVMAGAAAATTNAQGRFFLPALPLLATVVIELTEDSTVTNHQYHIDYARPVNSVTLSLPDQA